MLLWVAVIVVTVLLLRIFLRYNIAMCKSKIKMTGKVVIVTGANTGIGFYIARDLASRGARVILACRNEAKALYARDHIIRETGNVDVVYKYLDLSSLTSVKKFGEDIISSEERLDVLVNNAGVYGNANRYTEDGILEGMQVNMFAPMLLTNLLLPAFKMSKGRIVNVSSLLSYIGKVKPEKLNKMGQYGSLRAYSNSKFGMVAFTVELARRLEGSGVIVNSCHPGIVLTDILNANTNRLLNLLYYGLCWVCCRSPEEAAQTPVFLAVEACASGGFYIDCARWPLPPSAKSNKVGQDLLTTAEKLMQCKIDNIH